MTGDHNHQSSLYDQIRLVYESQPRPPISFDLCYTFVVLKLETLPCIIIVVAARLEASPERQIDLSRFLKRIHCLTIKVVLAARVTR